MQGDEANRAQQIVGQLQAALGGMQQVDVAGGVMQAFGSMVSVGMMLGLAYFLLPGLLQRGAGPTLALRSFDLDLAARGPNEAVIALSGRQTGILAWLFTTLGLNPLTTWSATRYAVRQESFTLFGARLHIVPLAQVSVISVRTGRRPDFLVYAVIMACTAFYLARTTYLGAMIGLLVAGGFFAKFFLTKQFGIAVHATSAEVYGVSFKPNLLEGVSIDLERLTSTVAVLQEMVRLSARPDGELQGGDVPNAAPRISSPPKRGVFVPGDGDDEEPPRREPAPREPAPPAPFVPPEPAAAEPRERSRKRRGERTRSAAPRELEAQAAFNAAVRVFESGRAIEAERAWKALIGRWPETRAAARAERILSNRRKTDA